MNPFYRQASFMVGAAAVSQFPEDTGHEAAFVGRSNAGKSSSINVITDNRSLARTSKLPGRTRQINFFSLDDSRRLVDLPGYGYAKVAKSMKQDWQKIIDKYLRTRQSLKGLTIIMDCRHPLTDFDRHLLSWCQTIKMPAHILLNKSDKLSRGAASATLHRVCDTLINDYGINEYRENEYGARESQQQDCTPSVQLFSALKKTGIEEVQTKLDEWLGFR